MKWRKQHAQILNKMTKKQEKALAAQLRTIECGEWSEGFTFDDTKDMEPQWQAFWKSIGFPEDRADQ